MKKVTQKYAVIKLQGHQYKVSEGEKLVTDHFVGEPKHKVLLAVDGDRLELGKPEVAKAKVVLKVETQAVKGTKIHVQTFKAKSRYRRKIGFRPLHTALVVEKISL